MVMKLLDLTKLAEYTKQIKKNYASKNDLESLVKKDQLVDFIRKGDLPKVATSDTPGLVKPDNKTIIIKTDGTISAIGGTGGGTVVDGLTKEEADLLYACKADLDNYATLTALQEYIKRNELKNYATQSDLLLYVTKDDASITYATKESLNEYAKKADISSVYKPKGSITAAELSGLNIAENVGNVYNIIDALTTDDNFVDGSGQSFPAGADVVVVEKDGEYKFDILASTVDFSNYIEKDEIDNITSADINALFT